MSYQGWSVTFGEQPSAAKWNILGTNDASFNDGSGIADSAITSEKLNSTVAFKAYRNTAHNVTSSLAKVPFDTELYDKGADFDSSTGVFTAPYKGIYALESVISTATATTRIVQEIVCSTAGTFLGNDVTATSQRRVHDTYVLELQASETVEVQALSTSTAAVAGTNTYFSGILLGRT